MSPKSSQPLACPQLLFRADFEHKILICIGCKSGVLVSGVAKHLIRNHKTLDGPARRAIRTWAEAFGASQLHQSQDRFQLPAEPVPAIQGLELVEDSLRCKLCAYISAQGSAARVLRAHLRDAHATEMSEHATFDVYFQHVQYCQRFFCAVELAGHPAASYFEVLPPPPEPASPRSLLAAEAAYSASRAAVRAALSKKLDTVPTTRTNDVSPWETATGLQAVLGGLNRPALVKLCADPTQDVGPGSRLLWDAVKTMLHTYQVLLSDKYLAKAIRSAVLRQDERVPYSPLLPYSDPGLKHGASLQKIFMFFWRSEAVARGDDQVPDDREAPRYSFTGPQRRAWAQIKEYIKTCTDPQALIRGLKAKAKEGRPELHELELRCHRFWLSLLRHEAKHRDHELAFLVALAACCLTNGGFADASSCATHFSALKHLARNAFCYAIYLKFPVAAVTESDESEGPDESQEDEMAPRPRRPTALSTLRQWTHKYLSLMSGITPMAWLIQMGPLARVHTEQDREGFVSWDGDRVSCRGTSVTLARFQDLVHRVTEDAEQQLAALLYHKDVTSLPQVPWDELEEKPGHTKSTWSLFNSSSQPCLAHGDDYVFNRMLSYARAPASLPFDSVLVDPKQASTVARYNQRVVRFRAALAVLIHLTYGQPARGTELLSVAVENGTETEMRNIFLVKGLLAVVTRYHKGYNYSRRPKPVYRFLPRPVGNLLFWFLWLGRPFFDNIQPWLDTQPASQHTPSRLLWPTRSGSFQPDSTAVLSRPLTAATELHLGTPIATALMRHILIAMGRRISGKDSVLQLLDPFDQAMVKEDLMADALELQAGHSVEVAMATYACSVETLFSGSSHLRDEHFEISTKWHNFLGFPLVKEQARVCGAAAPRLSSGDRTPLHAAAVGQGEDSRLRHRKRHAADIEALLCEAYGLSAAFRGEQRAVVQATFEGESPLVYVAATGSGKSMAFLLPALYTGFGLVVVIVPLVALRKDLRTRCEKMSVLCEEWTGVHVGSETRILLAMPEHVATEKFRMFLAQARPRIARIVVDECHVVLTDSAFRPPLQDYAQLVAQELPLTFLSATLPPCDEPALWKALGLGRCPPRLFREPTARSNIAYAVSAPPSGRPFRAPQIAAFLRSQQRNAKGKVLVFVQRKELIDRVASEGSFERYHRGMNEKDGEQTLERFRAASSGVLLATSCLGHGYHDPGITAVVHLGLPDGLMQYSQESGRAGRQGQRAQATLVVHPGLPSGKQHASTAPIRLYASMPGCRRHLLDRHLDGHERPDGCQPHEASCDLCSSTRLPPAGTPTPKPKPTGIETPLPRLTPLPSSAAEVEYALMLAEAEQDKPPLQATASPAPGSGGSLPTSSFTFSAASQPPPSSQSTSPFARTSHSLSLPRSSLPRGRPLQAQPQTPQRSLLSSPPVPSTAPPPWSTPSSLSPHLVPTRTRNGTPVPPSPFSRTPLRSTPSLDATVHRQERERAFVAHSSRERTRGAAQFWTREVLPCVEFWQDHCIVCWSRRRAWHHSKRERNCMAHTQTRELKATVRFVSTGTRDLCWSCWLGPGACPKFGGWQNGSCALAHVVSDVWAFAWQTQAEPLRRLAEQAQQESRSMDRTTPEWSRHYSTLVDQAHGVRVPAAVLEVVWLTKEYFRPEAAAERAAEGPSLDSHVDGFSF